MTGFLMEKSEWDKDSILARMEPFQDGSEQRI